MSSPFLFRTGPEEALIEELARQQWRGYPFRLENFPAGRQIMQSDAQFQSRAALALVQWLEEHSGTRYDSNTWKMRQALLVLLKRKLPLGEGDVQAILDWSIHARNNYWRALPEIIRVLNEYLKRSPLSAAVTKKVDALIEALEGERMSVEDQRRVLKLNELIGRKEVRLPLVKGDIWANVATIDIHAIEGEAQTVWAELLLHCLRAGGSAPSNRWLKDGGDLVAKIGAEAFYGLALKWFALADRPRPAPPGSQLGEIPLPANADVLKGLVWLCGASEQPETARELALLAISSYRRVRGSGPRAVKVGNACFWALGNMPSSEGMTQLSILKAKIKGTSPQKAIRAALDAAARRNGISVEDAEELRVPTYGFHEAGSRIVYFDEAQTEIRIVGTTVEQTWSQSGRGVASVPKEVKEKYAGELKEIDRTVKDLRKMLLAQRDRLDGLYLTPRKWSLLAWKQRYLDHPIVGTLVRRLIWKFGKDDRAESGIWSDGLQRVVGRDDKPLDWLDDMTSVELWHPISAVTEVVLGWREWLQAHEVQQPFKQAHREIYPLTDVERATNLYSNRFAAHILRQHQFHALCAARGWKNSLRLMVDADLPPATRLLEHWGVRAEFWVEGIGDFHETNETGAFLYLTTDQVRFYRSDALLNRSQARGGGYYARRMNGQGDSEPLPLDTIPPLVFSEIMRDVDLFVGVASVGNDPTWLDGGAGVRYRDYWHGYSFGELNETARTRKQVLETLVPRLKIASRCQLTDKFLVVSGDIRRYKIHLGSGNILMEPNDQYLCIVPSRRDADRGKEKPFLPFEGDQTLAVILSKAFLLAEDTEIKDPTIVRQLGRR